MSRYLKQLFADLKKKDVDKLEWNLKHFFLSFFFAKIYEK